MEKELNNKDISINKLNKEKQELEKKLNDEKISFNEYKRKLDNIHEQEIQKLKQELNESDIKNKNKVLKKITELKELNDEYIKKNK